MSRVPVGKVLLRNVIRHTGAHNKVRPGPPGAARLGGPLSSLPAGTPPPGGTPCPLLEAAVVRGSEWRRPGHYLGVAVRRMRGLGLLVPPWRCGAAGGAGHGAGGTPELRSGGARGGAGAFFGEEKLLVAISHLNILSLAFSLALFFMSSHPGEGMCMYIYL